MSALLFSLPLLWAQAPAPAPAAPALPFHARDTLPIVVVRPLERPHRHLGRSDRRGV